MLSIRINSIFLWALRIFSALIALFGLGYIVFLVLQGEMPLLFAILFAVAPLIFALFMYRMIINLNIWGQGDSAYIPLEDLRNLEYENPNINPNLIAALEKLSFTFLGKMGLREAVESIEFFYGDKEGQVIVTISKSGEAIMNTYLKDGLVYKSILPRQLPPNTSFEQAMANVYDGHQSRLNSLGNEQNEILFIQSFEQILDWHQLYGYKEVQAALRLNILSSAGLVLLTGGIYINLWLTTGVSVPYNVELIVGITHIVIMLTFITFTLPFAKSFFGSASRKKSV